MSLLFLSICVLIGLDWSSVRAGVLTRKLKYLRKLVGGIEGKLSSLHIFARKGVSKLSNGDTLKPSMMLSSLEKS